MKLIILLLLLLQLITARKMMATWEKISMPEGNDANTSQLMRQFFQQWKETAIVPDFSELENKLQFSVGDSLLGNYLKKLSFQIQQQHLLLSNITGNMMFRGIIRIKQFAQSQGYDIKLREEQLSTEVHITKSLVVIKQKDFAVSFNFYEYWYDSIFFGSCWYHLVLAVVNLYIIVIFFDYFNGKIESKQHGIEVDKLILIQGVYLLFLKLNFVTSMQYFSFDFGFWLGSAMLINLTVSSVSFMVGVIWLIGRILGSDRFSIQKRWSISLVYVVLLIEVNVVSVAGYILLSIWISLTARPQLFTQKYFVRRALRRIVPLFFFHGFLLIKEHAPRMKLFYFEQSFPNYALFAIYTAIIGGWLYENLVSTKLLNNWAFTCQINLRLEQTEKKVSDEQAATNGNQKQAKPIAKALINSAGSIRAEKAQ